MPIIVNLDVMMAKRKMSLNELSDKVGLTLANLSILKPGRRRQFDLVHWKLFVKLWIVSLQISWSIVNID